MESNISSGLFHFVFCLKGIQGDPADSGWLEANGKVVPGESALTERGFQTTEDVRQESSAAAFKVKEHKAMVHKSQGHDLAQVC
jgi:hypothetical protein